MRRRRLVAAMVARTAALRLGGIERRDAVRLLAASVVARPPRAEAATVSWLPQEQVVESAECWYTSEFVTYLSRVLLNYDDECRRWWVQDSSPSQQRFGEFASSVAYGIRRRYRSPQELLEALLAEPWLDEEAKRQLALAFTLLNERQPVAGIDKLLSSYHRQRPPRGGSVGAVIPYSPALNDYLQADPLALLPRTQVPVKARDGLYELRGLAPYPLDVRFRKPKEIVTLATYRAFAVAGALGCSATHSVLVPLDVVKTRMQTDPATYADLVKGVPKLFEIEGFAGLGLGFKPTSIGYAYYGLAVYPGYEFFSRAIDDIFDGPRYVVVLAAGALATSIACIGACPAEAVRIRVVADPATYRTPNPLRTVIDTEGFLTLYDGFGPLLARQIVFGSVKFAFFDGMADFIYSFDPTLRATALSRFFVAALSGLVAGSASALASQPADALLSKLNGDKLPLATALAQLARHPNLIFKGTAERCAWAAAVIAGQFALYDLAKSAFNVAPADLTKVLDVAL